MKKVYVLEDDADIAEVVRCALELSEIEVSCFTTIAQYKEALSRELPSVSLLDIMLPDGNGLDVLAEVKQRYSDMGVIMLSALGRETDKVRGLNFGADDYISKPFGILELAARVNALLRRADRSAPLVCKNIALDESTFTATLNGERLDLNNKEFKLLKYLMSNVGRVLSRESILNAVWGYDGGETRTVDNHIARLRKLGVEGIETVFGVGYKFKTE